MSEPKTEVPEQLVVRIALLVGSNGKMVACIADHMGWGDLAEGLDEFVGDRVIYPEAECRYILTTTVPRPSIKVIADSNIAIREEPVHV